MTSRLPDPPRPRAPRLLLVVAATVLCLGFTVGTAHAAVYDPLNIISDETMRASNALSRADIQAFLDSQPGVLKSYSCAEGGPNGLHSQVVKPASQIIFEAAQYWNVNPKLILATLDKEQSLISGTWHAGTYNGPYPMPAGTVHGTGYHLTNAMGVGCFPSTTDTHPGFGDQVWTGTEKLGQTTGLYSWYPGKRKLVHFDPTDTWDYIVPGNQFTWTLYTYTPHYPQKSIWTLYVKYFGDPAISPAMRPVYRFYRRATGTHFYTASEAEKYTVIKNLSQIYTLEGVAYSLDTSATNMTTPLYRFYNKKTGTHFYTASETEKASVIAKLSGTYRYEGVAYNVSSEPTGSTPVYRFYNKKTGTHFYTASEAEKANVIAKLSGTYRYEGVAFYLGAYVPPVTPPDPPALTAPPVISPDPSALTTPAG